MEEFPELTPNNRSAMFNFKPNESTMSKTSRASNYDPTRMLLRLSQPVKDMSEPVVDPEFMKEFKT